MKANHSDIGNPRDSRIDVLRCLGLSLIILAHVNPPAWLFQLRNFGAPLMVLVSGGAYGMLNKKESYPGYLWRRIKRLLFPAWIFLTWYFLILYVTGLPIETLTRKVILESYALVGGVGYLWIIRVLLTVSLLAPLIDAASKKIPGHAAFLASLLVMYGAYEGLLYWARPCLGHGVMNMIVLYCFYGIVFSLIFALGIRIPSLGIGQVLAISLFLLFVFAGFAWRLHASHGHFVPTQAYKYPPSAYYLAYGLGMATLAWAVVQSVPAHFQAPAFIERVVFHIARNSLWIYLWHIPLMNLSGLYPSFNFMLRYGFVFGGAAIIDWIQLRILGGLVLPKVANTAFRKNLRILFSG